MMSRNKEFLYFLGLFIIGYLFVSFMFTLCHEDAHRTVCRVYKGKPETTYFLWGLGDGSTQCFNMTENVPDEVRFLNVQAEVVGYHTTVLIITIFVCAFLLIGWDYWKLKKFQA